MIVNFITGKSNLNYAPINASHCMTFNHVLSQLKYLNKMIYNMLYLCFEISFPFINKANDEDKNCEIGNVAKLIFLCVNPRCVC